MRRVDIRTLPDGKLAGCVLVVDGVLADDMENPVNLEVVQGGYLSENIVKIDGVRPQEGVEVYINDVLRVKDWGEGNHPSWEAVRPPGGSLPMGVVPRAGETPLEAVRRVLDDIKAWPTLDPGEG